MDGPVDGGVPEYDVDADGTATTRGLPHWMQNVAPSTFAVPQFEQNIRRHLGCSWTLNLPEYQAAGHHVVQRLFLLSETSADAIYWKEE